MSSKHSKIKLLTIIMPVIILIMGFAPANDAMASPDQTETPMSLANYLPENIDFYAAMRTDAAFIENLNALYTRLGQGLAPILDFPPGVLPQSIPALLDMMLEESVLDFQAIRPVLGGSIAIGMETASMESDVPIVLIVIDLSEPGEAIALLDSAPAFTKSEEAGYPVYENPDEELVITIVDNIMYLSPSRDIIPFGGMPDHNLGSNPAFQETLALLPESAYDIFLYVDTGGILSQDMAEIPAEMMGFVSYLGPMAIGAKITDGNSLVFDLAQNSDYSDVQDVMGVMLNADPINPDFWQHIPANSSIVLHSSNLRAIYDSLKGLGSALGEPDIVFGLNEIETQIAAFTGLDFNEDILSWLTGDYAIYLSYDVNPETPSLLTAELYPNQQVDELGFGFGFVIEAVNPEKAQLLVDTMAPLISLIANTAAEGVTVSREEVAGANTIAINIGMPSSPVPVDFLIGANDSVLVMGTEGSAISSLKGSDGLNNSQRFIEAQAHLLPNTISMMYADQTAINALGDLTMIGSDSGMSSDEGLREAREAMLTIRRFAGLFHSATISSQTHDDGSMIGRFVLTFNR